MCSLPEVASCSRPLRSSLTLAAISRRRSSSGFSSSCFPELGDVERQARHGVVRSNMANLLASADVGAIPDRLNAC